MNDMFFRPWVGSAYSSGGIFGKRVMILGESHYCEEGCADCGNARVHPECCAFTNGVVSDYLNESLDRQRWMSTYLKFERSLVGHETDWAERKNVWNSVVFYNYLQAAMGRHQPAALPEVRKWEYKEGNSSRQNLVIPIYNICHNSST